MYAGEKTILAYNGRMSKIYNRTTEAKEVWPQETTLICLSLKLKHFENQVIVCFAELTHNAIKKQTKMELYKDSIWATCRTHNEKE